jgi:hypothetical protein
MRGNESNQWLFAAMGIARQKAQHQAAEKGESTWKIKGAVWGL